MLPEVRYMENLPELAAQAFKLSRKFCGPCQNYHSLWTYQRIARASGGSIAAPMLRAILGRLCSTGNERILIAGSADTGLLSVVLGVAHPDCSIVVVDRCETPLELCQQFSRRVTREILTVRSNLADVPLELQFDVILAHSVLQHIDPEYRLAVLSRLHRTLRIKGHLVLVFRTSSQIEGRLSEEYRREYARHVLEQLEAANIPLPESRDAFYRKLNIYAEERQTRQGDHKHLQEVEELIKVAGFNIRELHAIEPKHSKPFHELGTKILKQRFVAIATADS
jgi:hypothetical protein